MTTHPILVTGAGGAVGGVGRGVVERLLARRLPVRALVRRDDERAAALRALGAEVVVGDLTRAPDLVHALTGCRRMYLGLSVSAQYLEATVTAAAVARELRELELVVNMSQMTVSQMNLQSRSESTQQRLQWLTEKVLSWSGLPVIEVRPTIFLQSFTVMVAESVARDGEIRLPFGVGRTSPVDASDVADVIAALLIDPDARPGKVYELTGPRSQTLHGMAAEFSTALGRPVRYVDIPLEPWSEELRRRRGISEHLHEHLVTMARLHADNRYDRLTSDVERLAGHPATTVTEFVARHAGEFGGRHAQGQQPGEHA
jgi:uncharacterized protein YbjT (DUF2867 family)